MKKDYWIEQVTGKLYAVKWSDGTLSYTAYEGTEEDCEDWVRRKNGK